MTENELQKWYWLELRKSTFLKEIEEIDKITISCSGLQEIPIKNDAITSVQEKYIERKEKLLEKIRLIEEDIEEIEKFVESLEDESWKLIVTYKFRDRLSYYEISKKIYVSETKIKNMYYDFDKNSLIDYEIRQKRRKNTKKTI